MSWKERVCWVLLGAIMCSMGLIAEWLMERT